VNYLIRADADIFCFQEYFQQDHRRFSVTDSLKKMLRAKYVYTDYFHSVNNSVHFGLAIYSAFPIINSGKVACSNSRSDYAVFSDILWEGMLVRVYNVHLESIHFGTEDYTFYSEFSQNPIENKQLGTGTSRISRKLYHAFSYRAVQADEISAHIQRSPYPVIVCGDFNDTPCSYTYHRMASGLKDAFVEAGLGLGKTYTGIFPSYRIDYILYNRYFKAYQYLTDRITYSDHYPISTVLVKRPVN
jgi:endonuclease/exonuclease/phosphatase family metal-dependent hydrolase